jgi:hypothetical protein
MAKIAALLDKNCPVTENSIFTSIFSLLGPSFGPSFSLREDPLRQPQSKEFTSFSR